MVALNTHEALARLAADGLPGAPDDPIEVDSLDQLLIVADTQRVLAPLYRAVRAGVLTNTDEAWVARLRDRLFSAAETTLAAHAAAVDASRTLREADIPVTVIKGCATGPLDHAQAADRFSSDVDLVVPVEHRDAAVAALGGKTVDIVRRRRWHERYGHATTVTDSTGVEIDVHVRLNHGYVGLAVPTDEFVADGEQFEIGGEVLFAPDPAGRLLLAAVHADGVRTSLHALRDVPQLVLGTGADWTLAVERSERWRIDSFFAHGVVTAWSRFALEPHPVVEWAQHHRSTGRQRLLRLIPGDGARRQVLAGPLALPPHDWPGYVAPLLFPSREYVRRSEKGFTRRVAIVRGELRRRRPAR